MSFLFALKAKAEPSARSMWKRQHKRLAYDMTMQRSEEAKAEEKHNLLLRQPIYVFGHSIIMMSSEVWVGERLSDGERPLAPITSLACTMGPTVRISGSQFPRSS